MSCARCAINISLNLFRDHFKPKSYLRRLFSAILQRPEHTERELFELSQAVAMTLNAAIHDMRKAGYSVDGITAIPIMLDRNEYSDQDALLFAFVGKKVG